ncbi:MAG: hypothetical protein LBJ44_07235 [Propionibacteriaceae bacterium]|jgi:hypothetical protein|nr:hypothetical protein [Propionibacteriaceae bacterium]
MAESAASSDPSDFEDQGFEDPDFEESDAAALERLTGQVADWLAGPTWEADLTDPDGLPGDPASLIDQLGRLDPAQAAQVWGDLVERARARLAPNHPNTLQIRCHWARWLGASGEVGRALEEIDEVVAEQTSRLGPSHCDTLTSRAWQADLIGQAGDLEQSIARLEAVLADQRAAQPGPSFDAITTSSLLSQRLSEAGRKQDSLLLALRVMDEIPQAMAAVLEQVGQSLEGPGPNQVD